MEAEVAIEEAIKLQPFVAHYWGLLSNSQDAQAHLNAALKSVERGLELDPHNVHCHNLRAYILTKLKRSSDQAAQSMGEAIGAAPDDAVTHAYRGWTFLETSQHESAIEHFREALRIDPTLDWARKGMLKALEMRQWTYQLNLKMMTPWSWILMLIAFVAVNIGLLKLLRISPEPWRQAMDGMVGLASLLLFGFVVIVSFPKSFLSEIFLRFSLLFDPDGRALLNMEEKRLIIHFSIFAGLGLLAIPFCALTNFWMIFIYLLALYTQTLPLADKREKRTPKRWAGHLGLGVLICLMPFSFKSTGSGGSEVALAIIIGGVMLCVFISLIVNAMKTFDYSDEHRNRKQAVREQMMKDAGLGKSAVNERVPPTHNYGRASLIDIPMRYAFIILWPVGNLFVGAAAATLIEPLHSMGTALYHGLFIAYGIWFLWKIFPVPLIMWLVGKFKVTS